MSTASPPPAALQRLTDRKRHAIVEAAIAEFRQHGFEATSMDRVAATAGVSKRTVYNHFPSKDALFGEILRGLWQRSADAVNLAYRPDQPLRAQLITLLQQKLRLLDDPAFIDLSRVALAEGIHSPARARELISQLGSKEEGTTTWLRAALADGRLAGVEADFASQQLQALIKGFAFWPQITMGQPPLSPEQQTQVAESAVAMFLGLYGRE
ncbi:TetR/AcrR family transcriptional regulator [Xanthomonas campestris]|jgi:TetR/AcrR family transcriptional regulator of autoinduction and epiphytic fitness|uniref:TetR/AcrR family transcriptional regulator n=1 Tax=Xanthomonas TaxID=338 RepID=UPI0006B91759|nr:TetR/AcrR family transcriptional regulator [Xanthomonas campestris]ALE67212.1 TetR family transcriptional regulator [Xanthomonas campestris pv. campestris]MBF9173240.1 TetR/AcrR family transcriptional regulator [Xanthomonas campestris pv. campestris]MCC5092770.1 TetR/AcrR family transcriptional regulator [Xanthomonas campestris pv. incanae]MCC5097959.1 TetR/AcrR family transcriptional regulator [Xanthomonas campestris]MCF8792890.1 TetR/AcrR family transcriptional regulator [Xanthomonas camp